MYEGYLQNYSAKDGSLIQGSLSKEKKILTELDKETTALVNVKSDII
jgi:hypothetical protein